MTWSLIYFVASFRNPLPWAVDESASGVDILNPATDYLNNDVLHLKDVGENSTVIVGCGPLFVPSYEDVHDVFTSILGENFIFSAS